MPNPYSLSPPQVPPLLRAPVRSSQFVVELVGPRSVPATQAADLLRPDWRAGLGHPELWAMRPADTAWQPLRAASHGSYDSLALAWDMVSPAGEISTTSATHLVGLCERFANAIGRRAIPLTAPADLPGEIRRLKAAQDGLDAGVSVLLVSPRLVAVTEFGRELEALGLRPFGDEWAWLAEGHPSPLFAATPFDSPRSDGLTLGFRLAHCPDPNLAVEGMLRVVDALVRTGLAAFDEDRTPLIPPKRDGLRQNVRAASVALERAGFRPGSWGR